MDNELIAISDFHKLALFDLFRIAPTKTQYNGRFLAFFSKEQAEKILSDYDTGILTVVIRDYVASLGRVKDRIFESERAMRAHDGMKYGMQN